MLSKLYFVLILFIILSSICCKTNRPEYRSLIKKARDINSSIPDVKWRIHQYYYSDVEDYFALLSEQKDTSYFLKMYKSNLPDSIAVRRFYLYFEKTYTIKDTVYKLILDSSDTLCYYRYPINNPEEKDFIVGKYHYLFSNTQELEKFSLGQYNYFITHQDSLIKIRGNDLPELPNDTTYAK